MAFSGAQNEDISTKFKSKGGLNSIRETTKKMEAENRKMEERLYEFKRAMEREKEEKEEVKLGFWKSGQSGQLSSYGKDLIGQKIKKANSQKKKTPKVQVLKEEQIKVEERVSKVPALKNLSKSPGKENKVKGIRCGQCEERSAHVSCLECGEDYCATCFASFHLKGALKKHRSAPVGANVPRTPRSGRIVTIKPSPEEIHTAPPPEKSVEYKTEIVHENPSGSSSLLDGTYDEQANAQEFAEALRAWRGEKETKAPAAKVKQQPPVKTYQEPKMSTESGTSTEVQKGSIDIKFTPSLTYAEKLLLKMARRNGVGASPSPGESPIQAQSDTTLYTTRKEAREEENTSWNSPVTRIGLDLDDDELREQLFRKATMVSESRPTSAVSIIDVSDDTRDSLPKFSRREKSRYKVSSSTADKSGNDFRERKEAFLSSAQNAEAKMERELSMQRMTTPTKSTKVVQNGDELPRPKSRAMSARGARPKSRAERAKSAMGGQISARRDYPEGGVLVKTPSEELRNISQRVEPPVSYAGVAAGTLGDFFSSFVPETPRPAPRQSPRPKSARPKSARPKSARPKSARPESSVGQYKVSNRLYQLAPRSWKQEASVDSAIDESALMKQIQESQAAYNTFMDGMEEPMDTREKLSQQVLDTKPTREHLPSQKRPPSGRATPVSTRPTPRSARGQKSSTKPVLDDDEFDEEYMKYMQMGRITPNKMVTPRSNYRSDPMDRPISVNSYNKQAIVVDGDDMSQFDETDYQHVAMEEDNNTLMSLERELSQDPVVKQYKKSVMNGNTSEARTGASLRNSNTSKLTSDDLMHGTDINKLMRPSDLYDTEDLDSLQMDEDDVKALR